MLPSFCTDAVTVLRAPLIDVRGTQERDWESAAPHEVDGCSVQPASSDTAWTDPRQAVTVRAVLYAPPGSDIQAGDRVTFQGSTYAIDGEPMAWRSPTGRVSHIQANLTDWTG